MNVRYRVWVKENKTWEDCAEGTLTYQQAERIAVELRTECKCPTLVLPDGHSPKEDAR